MLTGDKADVMCLQTNPDDQTAKDLAVVMLETATLRSGYIIPDSSGFADRIDRMLRLSMDISLEESVSVGNFFVVVVLFPFHLLFSSFFLS